MRHDLYDRAGAARGQRLQLIISAPAEPLRDRSCQDALAVAGGDGIVALRLQLDWQR